MCALVEASSSFQLVPYDLAKGEQKSARLLALQPFGKVPAWEDAEGFAMYESRAIMRLVAPPHLVPDRVADRAAMEQWISVESEYFTPAFLPIYLTRALKKLALDEAALAARDTGRSVSRTFNGGS